MNYLVGNGTNLYRRSNSLVRTPIKISLSAAGRAYYSVAGTYDSNNFPNSGFLNSMTYNNVLDVGARCVQAYLNPTSKMFWRNVLDAHDPETVWYQGAYGTSANTLALAQQSAEAYMQFCGYRFEIPPSMSVLTVTSVTVKFTNGGGIQCYGPPYIRSSGNQPLQGFGDWANLYMGFYVSEYQTAQAPLLSPSQILNTRPYDAKIDLLADTGDYRGDRNLWNFGGNTRDGGIPALVSPPTKSYDMGSQTLAFVNGHRDFWITPLFWATYTNATNYRPLYVNQNQGWWGCFSLWGISIEVELSG